MSKLLNRAGLFVLAAALCLAAPVHAAEAPYDAKLLRLAEVLGSLHYLRTLCGEKGNPWREQMQKMLETENPEPDRRARLVARFNHGYRSFAAVHVTCTDTAISAIERYKKEGEALTGEIVVRYGN
jgi:uncharacterized protein (TIGR02301 family)